MEWIDLAQDRERWHEYGEHGNELSDYIKRGQFLERLRKSQLLFFH